MLLEERERETWFLKHAGGVTGAFMLRYRPVPLERIVTAAQTQVDYMVPTTPGVG